MALTERVALTVVAVAVIVHMAGTIEVGLKDAIAGAVSVAIAGALAVAVAGITILRSPWREEARAERAVTDAEVGSVQGVIAGIAATVAGAVAVARTQLQWTINKTWWAIRWVNDKLKWVKDKLQWMMNKLKWVKEKLQWVKDKLKWVKDKLKWVTDKLQWVKNIIKWVKEKLKWVKEKLKWVKEKLQWVKEKLQWVKEKLKWVKEKLHWVKEKLKWVKEKLKWVKEKLQWVKEKLQWVKEKLKWVKEKLKWVKEKLHWVKEKLQWVKEKLKWVKEKLQWVKEKLQWVKEKLKWVKDKLQWVTDKLQWVKNIIKWVKDKLKWVTNKLQWVKDKLKWVTDKLQWVKDKLKWVTDKLQWVKDQMKWVKNKCVTVVKSVKAVVKSVKAVVQRFIEVVEQSAIIQLGSAIATGLSGLVAAGAAGAGVLLGGIFGLAAGAASQWRGQTQAAGMTENTPRTNESPQTDNAQQTTKSWTDEAMESKESPLMPGNIMKKLLDNLGLIRYYDEKLTLHRVLQIDKNSVTDMSVQSPKDLPWLFLKRLMMLQRTARSVKCPSSDGAKDSEWDGQDSAESDCPQSVNPLDILTAVFLCSDSFLQQEMITKMSMCQFAVPLLLPNCYNNQITLMLWAMRDIVKKYRPHLLENSSGFVEERIVLSDLPLVSFVRLGRCNISKSEILNKLLSNPQQYTETFVHFNMDCGNVNKNISNGLVEMAWYLPCGNKNIDVFPEPVAIANLRGDIQNFETQYSFLCEASTAVFMFFESQLLDTQLISVPSQKSMPKLFFVGDSNNESIKATVNKLKLEKSNFIFKAKQNDADFVDKLQSKLQEAIRKNSHKVSVVHLAEIARNQKFLVDEDVEECQCANKCAYEITSKINNILQFKKKELPLQGEILMKLAKLEKEECRMKNLGDTNIEKYKSDLEIKKKKLREEQCSKDMSKSMSCFISAISTSKRAYFLKWIRIALENLSHKELPPLREEYKQKCHNVSENKLEIAELDKKISNSSLGVEHFIREMSQLYEAAVLLSEDAHYRKQLKDLPRLCAELLLDGFSLELMDGDSSNIPMKWLSSVFSELDTLVESKNKIMVITVLGVQSSGKSTLLNTMFGVQFAVSSGRCTRGAFMQLIKVADNYQAELNCDYIVIIDTEGLKSSELAQLDNSYEHDNELATLVVGLSDVTIVNIAMENSTEMKDILQIIVHAFLRMKEIGKKHKCLFVHQNVADVSAHDSNMRERKFLLEQLDEMTQAAAKMENKLEFSKFTDVMNYDTEGDHYIPGLWHGNPPMAPVSIGYSESVYALKKNIMDIFKKFESYNLKEFLRWTESLWTAVKHEKFIFSFRNSLVADAYIKLCTEYNRWDWTLRKQMHTWALEAETKILNHGKFKNSECITDFRCHLLQEAEDELSKGQDEIIDKIKSYYEQRDCHVELVESYRQDFINSVKFLKTELSCSITIKLDAAVSRRNGMMKVEGIKKTYMDTMEKKVLNLLKDCRENKSEMSDFMLDEAFEKMWQETIKTLPCTGLEKQDIMTRVLSCLRKNLNSKGGSVTQRLNQVKDLKNHGLENFVACKDKNRFSKWFSKTRDSVQEMSENLIGKCLEFVKAKRERKDDYDDTYTSEILNMIDEYLKAHEDLNLKEDFELSLKLHICGFASREFQKLHIQFIHENDPRTALENLKQTYHSDFFDLYRDRDQCQKKADEFTRNCLKPALERYMSEVMGTEMAGKMLTGENSAIFGSNARFQNSVLKSLLDEDKFETYLHFINSYETFVKDKFILVKIKQYFSEQNRMFILEERILKEVISDIKNAITEAEQDSKTNDIKGFIENICKALEYRLVFPKDAVDKISTLNKANQKNFTECLQCSLEDMEKSLKKSFKETDFQSKIDSLQTKPQDVLFKQRVGCGKQCPFCKAPCEAGGEAHTKHFASVHRPSGLGRYRFEESKQLVTEICTSLVHSSSNRCFKCKDTNDKWYPYDKYKEIYPEWEIKPEKAEATVYWRYVMNKFNQRFAEKFGAEPAEIPLSWKEIEDSKVKESLK